jgi:uncharacterized membrane protein YhhN
VRTATAVAGYAALAAADTALAASASPTTRRFRLVTKPLLMPALGAAFATALAGRGLHRGGLLRGGTVAAQALSGLGDLALLGTARPAFLAGLGSFFGAHVSYTTAFLSAGEPLSDRRGSGGMATALAVFATLGPAASVAAGRRDESLAVPVLGYAGALAATLGAATRLDRSIPRRARGYVVAGSALFLVSDSLLATRLFLHEGAGPRLDATVMATYTAAQGLIAAGVVEAVRALAPA